MKISELIALLENVKIEHGDIEIERYQDEFDDCVYIEGVYRTTNEIWVIK